MPNDVSCTACDRRVADGDARWCGHCGHPLAPRRRRTRNDAAADVVLPVGPDTATPTPAEGRAPLSRRSRILGGAVVLIVLGGLLAIQVSRPAPPEPHGYTARGVPARTGVASVAAVKAPTRVLWQTAIELPSVVPGGAVVHASADLVYVVDLDGQGVTAHDAATGDVRWSRPDVAPSERDPLVAGDTLVIETRGGVTLALGPDGGTRWTRPAGNATLVAAGGGIGEVHGNTTVTLLDISTGEPQWSVDIVETMDASAQYVLPHGPEDLVIVLGSRPEGLALGANPELETGHLVGIEARTGEVRWELELPSGLAWFEAPLAVDDRIAVAANVSRIVFWDLATGRRIGEHLRPIAFRPLEVVAADGAAVLLDPSGTISAIGPDGTTRWTAETTLPADLDVRGGTVVVSTRQRITIHDASTGALAGGLPVDASSRRGPPAPDGSAFVIRRDGRLVSYAPDGGARFDRATVVPETASPAVADGMLYASTGTGLSVLSGEDGAPIWEYRNADPTASTAGDLYMPVVADDVVIVSPPRSQPLEVGGVFALQRETGILAWQRLTDRPSPRGPLTFDRDLALLPVDDELHGHAPVGGRRALAATAYGPRGPIAAGGGLLVAATPVADDEGNRTVVAVRRADRSRVWEEPASACTPPAIADGQVLVGTDRGVRALDLATGRQRWNAVLTSLPVCGELVVGAGRVVGVSGGIRLVAAEVAGGAPSWELGLPAAVAAPPVIAGDEVLVTLVDGTLLAVGIRDGDHRWSLEVDGIPAASPVVVDGHIVMLLRDGRLLALATS